MPLGVPRRNNIGAALAKYRRHAYGALAKGSNGGV
jgi:hypothetical protein